MRQFNWSTKETAGFSLVELLIVMAIIGILLAVAVPAYDNHMTSTRRAEGKTALLDIMGDQERFLTINDTYTVTLGTGGLGLSVTTVDGVEYASSETDAYKVKAEACGTGINACVKLTAIPQGTQSSDGNLTLDSIGNKTPADSW